MSDSMVNPSIKCSVDKCAYHCSDKEYCSLNEIKVGATREPVSKDCTQCSSFATSISSHTNTTGGFPGVTGTGVGSTW